MSPSACTLSAGEAQARSVPRRAGHAAGQHSGRRGALPLGVRSGYLSVPDLLACFWAGLLPLAAVCAAGFGSPVSPLPIVLPCVATAACLGGTLNQKRNRSVEVGFHHFCVSRLRLSAAGVLPEPLAVAAAHGLHAPLRLPQHHWRGRD